MSASNVLVSLTRVNGQWLITKFDPISASCSRTPQRLRVQGPVLLGDSPIRNSESSLSGKGPDGRG